MYRVEEDLLPIGRQTNRPGIVIKVGGIISHRTGNSAKTADAIAHRRYFGSGYRSASAHYFVDSARILRIIPENEMAWHAGLVTSKDWSRGNPNNWAIGIEICENNPHLSPEGREAYRRYVWLHADICRRHGLDPQKDIFGHFMVDPKNRAADPAGLFQWETFIEDVYSIWLSMIKPIPGEQPGWDPAGEIRRLKERGIINTDHPPAKNTTWAEVAAIANRILDRFGQ